MIIVSINQLKLFSESRGIKDYDSKIEDELIKIFSKPKPKINFSKKRTEKILMNLMNLEIDFQSQK